MLWFCIDVFQLPFKRLITAEINLHITVTQQLVWDSKQGKELVLNF